MDFTDIQHFLLMRTPALVARCEFLTFRSGDGGRAWLDGIVDKVGTAKAVGTGALDSRWVTIAFTWNGLRALGVSDALLETFPDDFKQGMAARAGVLGTTGANHPDHWVDGLASPDLHAIAILFARNMAERDRRKQEHDRYLSRIPGVEVLSGLDLEATPPFDYAHDHLGYRDRLSQPVVAGTGVEAIPGSGPPIEPGEFFLGYVDESGFATPLPQPEVLSRNGSYLAYLRLEEHVGRFREFLRQHGETRDALDLGGDLQRNNFFNYGAMDAPGENMQRRRMIRRAGTYGPHFSEGASDNGAERGIAAFVGCASLVRQFEFAMNVWVNNTTVGELASEKDPFEGLPAFTTVRGGAYFFLPGIRALRFLAAGASVAVARSVQVLQEPQ